METGTVHATGYLMLRRIFLPTIFILLTWGFWVSPDFKTIAAGVSIFLFGMLALEQGFRAFAGGTLEHLLAHTTDKLWKSLSFGVISSTLMQSSSLVSVITISFLSTGLLSLASGIGIVFGANLGTTTGAWLVAAFGLKVKISAYAMPMLVFGVLLIFQEAKKLKGVGYILVGLGFLFLGIHYMKEGFEAFKDQIDLAQYAVAGYPGLFLFASIGVSATVVMQSSHATLVMIITALASGQITYDNALALAIGANIGTTITAIIGAMSANEQGKRLAAAHLLFNLTTGILAIAFIHQFIAAVDWISDLTGIAEDDYTLKLAVFHTLFNTLGIAVMLPFTGKLVWFLSGIFQPSTVQFSQPKFLSDSAIGFPDTALKAIRQETMRMWDHTTIILTKGLGFNHPQVCSEMNLESLASSQRKMPDFDIDATYEQDIKSLYGAIIVFISRVSASWENEQSGSIHWLRSANQNMVGAIKSLKHLRKNLVKGVASPHPQTRAIYNELRVQVCLLIRQLEMIRQSSEEESPALSLDNLQAVTEDHFDQLNSNIATAISEGVMSGEVVSSLMNDLAYAQEISRKLVEMAETLFVRHNRSLSQAEKDIMLNEEELKALEP